jgi:Wzt C-terminal domain
VLEARRALESPVFGVHFLNANGAAVFGFNRTLRGDAESVPAGGRVRIAGRIDNALLPGRYFVSCMVSRNRAQGDLALHVLRLLDFVVYGTRPGPGDVSVRADVEAELEC